MIAWIMEQVATRAMTLGKGMPIHTSGGVANNASPNPTALCATPARQMTNPATTISNIPMFAKVPLSCDDDGAPRPLHLTRADPETPSDNNRC